MKFTGNDDKNVSIDDPIEGFRNAVGPYVEKGDFQGVKRLFSRAYSFLVSKFKGHSLEEEQAKQAMEKALEEVLSKPLTDRPHYFTRPGSNSWRRNRGS